MKDQDFIIVLAWPEGMTTAAGAWYDKIASTNGKYRVGHSALALVNSETEKIHYFDFGRYHTPEGFGRVRDPETDPDIGIKKKAKINQDNIKNIDDILIEIATKESCHGKGTLYASIMPGINFDIAFNYAKKWQEKGLIPYGPFIINGTNCSRFVSSVSKKISISFIQKMRFKFPITISPSPKRNVSIANPNYYIVKNKKCDKINRGSIESYFKSIEK